MEQILTITFNGEPQLVRYKKSKNKLGTDAFFVETSIVGVERFHCWVEGNGFGTFPAPHPHADKIMAIVRQIQIHEDSK